MDLAQLANGRIVYSPSGTDISFKMEVVDKSQKKTTSESVRMLRTRPSPLQEQTDAAAKAAAAAGPKPTRLRRPTAATPDRHEPAVTEQPKPVTPLKAFQSESLSTETASGGAHRYAGCSHCQRERSRPRLGDSRVST